MTVKAAGGYLTNGVIFVLALFASILLGSRAMAQEYAVAGYEKLILVVPVAQVNIVAGNSPTVKIQGNAGSWSARQEGNTLRLVGGLGVAGVKNSGSRVDIQIPPINIEVHVQEGSVLVQKWSKPFLVDLQKGRLTLKENQAKATLSVGQGSVTVADHQGPLSVDAYKADLSIEKQNGNFEASVFSGDVKVDQSAGVFNIDIFQGGIKMSKSSGSLTFSAVKAGSVVTDFAGRIEGQSQEGAVQLDALPDAEIQIKSEQGRIALTSKQSGAFLVAQSAEGDIQPPKNMRVGRDKTSRIVKGRLKGPSSTGRVELFSQKNLIVVRD